jgi:hypothetical protein
MSEGIILADGVPAMPGVPLTASGVYHSYLDISNEWGLNNLLIWLDLDNDKNTTTMNTRLQTFINRTESYVNARLLYSRYNIPFSAPVPLEIVEVCAILSGAFCYRPRSIEDFDPEKGAADKSLVIVRKKTADKMLADILMDRIILATTDETSTMTDAPRVVKTDHLHMRRIGPHDPQSADTLTDQQLPYYGITGGGPSWIELTGG